MPPIPYPDQRHIKYISVSYIFTLFFIALRRLKYSRTDSVIKKGSCKIENIYSCSSCARNLIRRPVFHLYRDFMTYDLHR